MSNSAVISYFGIIIDMSEEDIVSLETRTHPLIAMCKSNSLDHYWGNFSTDSESYKILIGKQIAKIGFEDSMYSSMSISDVRSIMLDVETKLNAAGLSNKMGMHIILEPNS